MKTTNLPEEQSISWKLRQPAPRLKRRIFRDETGLPSLTWFWGALAPASVCVLLTFFNFNPASGFGGQRPLLAVALSNQSDMAYAAGGSSVEQNHWASLTFDWTNHSVFNSSNGFTPPTNLSN